MASRVQYHVTSRAYQYHEGRQLEKRVILELGKSDTVFEGDSSFGGDSTFGSFLVTTILLPGDADAYLRETDAQVKAVENDVNSHREKLPADFLSSWDFFDADWISFFAKHIGDVNVLDGGRGLMDQTDTYVGRLKTYQEKMAALGVAPNAPGVSKRFDDPSNPAGVALTGWEKAALGAGAALGAVVLFKIAK